MFTNTWKHCIHCKHNLHLLHKLLVIFSHSLLCQSYIIYEQLEFYEFYWGWSLLTQTTVDKTCLIGKKHWQDNAITLNSPSKAKYKKVQYSIGEGLGGGGERSWTYSHSFTKGCKTVKQNRTMTKSLQYAVVTGRQASPHCCWVCWRFQLQTIWV